MAEPGSNKYDGGAINQEQQFTDPRSGKLTAPARRFLDMLWKRTGGALDGIWEVANVAFLADQISAFNQALAGVRTDIEAVRAQAEAAANQIIVRGKVDRQAIERGNAVSNFSGTIATQTGVDGDMVKSSVATPTVAAADYKTVAVRTANVTVQPGDRLEVSFSYKLESVQNSFEHFAFRETVEVMQGQTATVAYTISDEYFPFAAAGNTGYVSTTWTGDVNDRWGETITVDVPDPFSGSWPSDGIVSFRLTLTPATNADGTGTNAVSGMINPANTKSSFKHANRRITVRLLPKEINELVS